MELLNLSNDDTALKDNIAETLEGIARRGNRQEFINVYFLLQHFSLEEILDYYAKRHPTHSLFRALMGLTFFADTEKLDMPEMYVDFDWEQCKSFILNKVKEYENRY
ncbi:MAG: hypothetical protein IJQ83_08670 [Bacteroidales bacterium]|nr:hypothetical protein [Bacteroidales bacterium]